MKPLKINSFYSVFCTILVALSVILRGGWGYEAVLLFGSSVLVLCSFRKNRINLYSYAILILACILYVFFGAAGYVSTSGICGVLFSLNMLFCIASDINNINYFLNGIWSGCAVVCIIGLLCYSTVVTFDGCVLYESGVARFQSLIQYANTSALFMAIGYMITVYLRIKSGKKLLFAFEILFLAAVFLTYSKILIVIFIGMLIVLNFMLKKQELMLNTAINVFFAALTAITSLFLHKIDAMKFMLVLFITLPIINCKINAFICEKYKRKGVAALAAMSILYAAGVIILPIYVLKQDLSALSSLCSRFTYMYDAMGAIADNPISGIGIGMWQYRQFFYQSAFYDVSLIHNGLLQFALDAGIPAFCFFITAIVVYVIKMIGSIKKSASGKHILIFSIFLLILFHSAFDVDLGFCSVSAMFFGCFALLPEEDGKKVSIFLPELIIFVFCIFVIIGQSLYNIGIKKDEQSILRISSLIRINDSKAYYELSKKSDKKEALELIKAAEKNNPYDYNIMQGGFVLAFQNEEFEEMYSYAIKWINVQPLNDEAYEAAAFALGKLYENGLGAESVLLEKNKIISAAEAANEKTSVFSKYIKENSKIDINKISEEIFEFTGM